MTINRSRAALYTLCVLRARLRAGALIDFIEDWQRVVLAAGREVSAEEYARLTHRYAYRTVYHHLRHFRKTFPELGDDALPSALMGPLLLRLAEDANAVADAEAALA